jgi:glycosyltransferase involved in cell wall biosynthesis
MAFKAPDGGAAENVLQLASRVGAHGWEVELVGPLESRIYEHIPDAIHVHRLPISPGYASLRENAAALRGLRTILRARHFDLLHAHSAQAGVLARLVRLAGGPPVVYTPHCFTFLGNPARARSTVGLNIERALAPLTSAFIDVSSYERRAAIKQRVGRGEHHHLVPNGCEPCPDVSVDGELHEFKQEHPLVVLVASLRPQKRIDVFLRALPEVFRRVPDARAALIGNGAEHARLQRLAGQLGLGENERFLMASFHDCAARYLKCADLYALSSGWESLPIGVLEALACGVPQVATHVGGVSEAVGVDTGVLVPPEDPAALAQGLVVLLSDDERRRKMSEASRARHRELFGLERMVEQTVGVYETVLSSAPRWVSSEPSPRAASASSASDRSATPS